MLETFAKMTELEELEKGRTTPLDAGWKKYTVAIGGVEYPVPGYFVSMNAASKWASKNKTHMGPVEYIVPTVAEVKPVEADGSYDYQ